MKVLNWDGMALGEPIKARLVLDDKNSVRIALSGFSVPAGDYLSQEQLKELTEMFIGLNIAAENLCSSR